MAKYLAVLYYTKALEKEVEASTPEEARKKVELEVDAAEPFHDMVFEEAIVVEEILSDGRRISVE